MSKGTVIGLWVGPLDAKPSSYIVKMLADKGSQVRRISREEVIDQCRREPGIFSNIDYQNGDLVMTNGEQIRYPNVASSNSLEYHAPLTVVSRHIISELNDLEVFKLCSYSGDSVITDASHVDYYVNGAGITNARIVEMPVGGTGNNDDDSSMIDMDEEVQVALVAMNGQPFQIDILDEVEENWVIENLAFLTEQESKAFGSKRVNRRVEQITEEEKQRVDKVNKQLEFMRAVIGEDSDKCPASGSWKLADAEFMSEITRGMMNQYEVEDAIYGEVVPSVTEMPIYKSMRRLYTVPSITAFFDTLNLEGNPVAIEAPVALYAMSSIKTDAENNYRYQIWRLAYEILLGGTKEENEELLEHMGLNRLVMECDISFAWGDKDKADKIMMEKCYKYGKLACKLACNAGNIAKFNEVNRSDETTVGDKLMNFVRKFKAEVDTAGVDKETERIRIK